jgi:2-polyprenyl-3-methyl-5-hydroxy-6-metoxy-1,4-benzoquinol methylase
MAAVGVRAQGGGRVASADASDPFVPDQPTVAARGARRVRRLWDRRALVWEHHGAAGLERVVDAVVDAAGPVEGKTVVDLGCGNGQLSLPFARRGAQVLAVDISARMIETVAQKAAAEGLRIDTAVRPAQELVVDPGSIDLVVSNYAMHHLYDNEKRAVLAAAATWLRPGGRVVFGDMMFGRGATKQDREIIGSKVRVMLRRGPAGWWRIAKNAARFTLRMRERPLPMWTWVQMFRDVGLADVQGTRVVAEAAIVTGTKPVV